MNLAALQERHLVHAERFGELHAHIGKALGVARQESHEHALDRLRAKRVQRVLRRERRLRREGSGLKIIG
jgi:hypothetical protein